MSLGVCLTSISVSQSLALEGSDGPPRSFIETDGQTS